MTPNELSGNVDGIIGKAEVSFGKKVSQTQTALFEQMQLLMNKLELHPDGTIMQNRANREVLAKVDVYFNRAFNETGYYNELNGFTGDILKITAENTAYFSFVEDSFSANSQWIKSLQKQTMSDVTNLLANEGLEAAMKQPIVSILNQNVNTSASFNDLLKQVREFTLGTDQLQGQLQRYSRQIVNDSLFNYNRALQEGVSEQAGLQWYVYSGGLRTDSRPFCVSRAGKYYPKDEVEKWASQNWEGKRRGTTASTIFVYAGGYFCSHQLIAVSESVVPKTNKDARTLQKKAKTVGGELDSVASRIAKKNGAALTPLNFKSYDSTVRKAKSELNGIVLGKNGVKDAVRTTIITDGKNLKNVASEMGSEKIITQLKQQNYTSTGYRGYLGNVKLSNGTFGEIQINTPEMIYAKEAPDIAKHVIGVDKWNEINRKTGLPGGLGHEYYEQERVLKGDDIATVTKRESIQAKSREYYSKFYYSYPDWP